VRCRIEFTKQQPSSLAALAAYHQLNPLRLATFWASKPSLRPETCLCPDAFLSGSFYSLSPTVGRDLTQALQHLKWALRHFLEQLFALSFPCPSRDDADFLTSCRLRPILRHLAELVHHLEV